MKTIPDNLVNALLEYLSQRPYREVAGLIAALAGLEPAEEKGRKLTAVGDQK